MADIATLAVNGTYTVENLMKNSGSFGDVRFEPFFFVFRLSCLQTLVIHLSKKLSEYILKLLPPRGWNYSSEPDHFQPPSKSSTSQNIRQRTRPYILILANLKAHLPLESAVILLCFPLHHQISLLHHTLVDAIVVSILNFDVLCLTSALLRWFDDGSVTRLAFNQRAKRQGFCVGDRQEIVKHKS